MDEKVNISWPGWETVQLIGRGSFGAVYEIQRDVFGETEKAALKVISIPQNESDIREMLVDGYDEESITSTFAGHLKNIVTEYSLMRKMNGSANIVNCDDFRYEQHEDGVGWDIFIKMELLTPMADILPAGVSEEQVIKIAKDMCAALELCQKHNIIHRDIKPQNIFVSENGDYKLGDFGIAKTVEKTMGGTKTGTYKYMAPEVYSNRPYNSTADIYSLGLVLYWLLNERRMPFMPLPPEKLRAGMDEESRSRRFSGEKIPAPKNGSNALKQIVLKACAFDPKDRYQSARGMREDLQRLSGGQAAEFIPEPKPTPILDAQDDADDNKTMGPIFKHTPVDDADGLDKTVGPVFGHNVVDDLDKGNTAKPNTQNKKQKGKKPFGVVAALLVLSILCSFLFSDKDTELISAEQTTWNNEEQDISPLIDRTPKEETFSSDTNKDFVMNGLNAEIDEDPVPTDAAKETTKSNSKYADIEDKINNTKLVHKPENLYDEPIAYIVVSKEGVIRSGCGTDYLQIGGVIQGDTVYVYAKRGTWFFIENEKGIIGWAGFKMVKKE